MTTHQWPFDEPRNVAVITTAQVLEQGYPILLVTHEDDGTWQFLCGTTDRTEDGRVVGLGNLFGKDPTIGALADLPYGWRAWRTAPGSAWQREQVRP